MSIDGVGFAGLTSNALRMSLSGPARFAWTFRNGLAAFRSLTGVLAVSAVTVSFSRRMRASSVR